MVDLKDVEDNYVVGTDSRGNDLTHYVLAERLVMLEMAGIISDYQQGDYCTLTSILEDGFRGYHKMSSGELWSEWKDVEDKFFRFYDDNEFAYSISGEDPLAKTSNAYTQGEGI